MFGKKEPFIEFEYKKIRYRTKYRDDIVWRTPSYNDEFILDDLENHMLDIFQLTAKDQGEMGVIQLGKTDIMQYRLTNTINKMKTTTEPITEKFAFILDGKNSGLVEVEFQGIDNAEWEAIQAKEKADIARFQSTVNRMTKDSTLVMTIMFCSLGEEESNEFGVGSQRELYFRFVFLGKVFKSENAKTRHEGLPIFNETFELRGLKHAVSEKKSMEIEAHQEDENHTYYLGKTNELPCYEFFCNSGLEMGARHQRAIEVYDNKKNQLGTVTIAWTITSLVVQDSKENVKANEITALEEEEEDEDLEGLSLVERARKFWGKRKQSTPFEPEVNPITRQKGQKLIRDPTGALQSKQIVI